MLDDNSILFEEYNSYSDAENNILTFGKRIINKNALHYPLDITKLNKKYELVKIHNGNVFKLHPLGSLEEVKIVYDILLKENWDFKIFKKYNFFYLNELYWRFKVNNNEIKLISRLESINSFL